MRGRVCSAFLLALALAGCAQDPHAAWKNLDVVYASQVPVYPGASVSQAMGGDSYGEGLNDHVSESITHWFKVTPFEREKILAYYEKNLPNARKTVEEDGDVKFELTPQGAEGPLETVWVVIEQDQFRIGEETKPGKHKNKGLLEG